MDIQATVLSSTKLLRDCYQQKCGNHSRMRGLSNGNELSTRGGAKMSCGQDGCGRQAESSRVELGAEDEMSSIGNAMQTDMGRSVIGKAI